MKKIILMFLTLLMFVACRKADEIKESITTNLDPMSRTIKKRV